MPLNITTGRAKREDNCRLRLVIFTGLVPFLLLFCSYESRKRFPRLTPIALHALQHGYSTMARTHLFEK